HARDMGQTLAEDLGWALRITAAETADSRPQLDRNTLPGQVVQLTEIATVSRVRAFSANRTHGLLLNMDDQPKSVSVALDPIQDQDVRAREKGLRMARGRHHRSPSLNILGLTCFMPDAPKLRKSQISIGVDIGTARPIV